MLKKDLEARIAELEAQLSKANELNNIMNNNIDKLNKEHEKELNRVKSEIFNKEYEDWKKNNEKFIGRYLRENLSIEIEHTKHDVGYFDSYIEDDPNNFSVSLKLNNKEISNSESC
jgi:hypothetical protein